MSENMDKWEGVMTECKTLDAVMQKKLTMKCSRKKEQTWNRAGQLERKLWYLVITESDPVSCQGAIPKTKWSNSVFYTWPMWCAALQGLTHLAKLCFYIVLKGLASETVMLLRHVKTSDVDVLSLLFVSCVGTEYFRCSVGTVKPDAYHHSYKNGRRTLISYSGPLTV